MNNVAPPTAEEVLHLADPGLSDEARLASAKVIADGMRANQAYWNSRPEMEQVMARVDGHDIVPSHADLNGEDSDSEVIEGSSVDEVAAGAPPDAADRLREQVKLLGGTPEV